MKPKRYKMIDSKTHRLFGEWRNDKALQGTNVNLVDIYLIAYPNASMADMMELMEFSLYNQLLYEWHEIDEVLMSEFLVCYEKEYLNVIESAFIAGYIEFGSSYEESINSIYNLSTYKQSCNESWEHFKTHFIDNEQYFEWNAKCDKNLTKETFWDNPKCWSRYNVWIDITPKGTQYFNEILAPRFYNKYKDLEVEIDEKGNILRWIGEINR
ncbi:hypothetical protein OQH61_05820 [Helicobacter sp. MIT 21-1697]|uniref:hypothetical protein n=1 Tax=Helicobacter sp. MIT 21-1697 TaxID=2993733 RepID=UPI00224AE478|nr:hypothetical protein [Helicobacter sp. MIT 21-1697]MCX2717252.1 hypothetical protein [Helicobacter sp. MIT 21-1697]